MSSIAAAIESFEAVDLPICRMPQVGSCVLHLAQSQSSELAELSNDPLHYTGRPRLSPIRMLPQAYVGLLLHRAYQSLCSCAASRCAKAAQRCTHHADYRKTSTAFALEHTTERVAAAPRARAMSKRRATGRWKLWQAMLGDDTWFLPLARALAPPLPPVGAGGLAPV
jgi:hypothetical protein